MLSIAKSVFTLVVISTLVAGHPGHDPTEEIQARAAYLNSLDKVDIAHCAPKLAKRGDVDRTVERRRNILKRLREERGFDVNGVHHRAPRQLGVALAKSHKSSLSFGASPLKADWALLGQNRSTILAPEQTEGPYYVAGEWVRKNVKDNEKGVDLHMDIQIVDMNTCTPVPNVALDIWHANATGVYSGIVGLGNGDRLDKMNQQNKALRGIQISDKNGAAQFETIVPGHYGGRTHHIHVMSTLNVTTMPNNTIQGGYVSHVGQLYFDQDLLDAVEKVPPYSTNKLYWTKNAYDFTMYTGAVNGADPLMEYVLIGQKIEDGIFAWINFGIDAKQSKRVMAAAECSASGCAPAGIFGFLGSFDPTKLPLDLSFFGFPKPVWAGGPGIQQPGAVPK